MRLDVRKCNAERKYAGDLNFEAEGDPSWIDIPFVQFDSPITVSLHYEILEDDSVEITGTVTFFLKGMCSRCLNETRQSVTGEAEGCFSTVRGEEDYDYKNGVIDFDEFVRDAVLSALPSVLLCGGNCNPPDYEK